MALRLILYQQMQGFGLEPVKRNIRCLIDTVVSPTDALQDLFPR